MKNGEKNEKNIKMVKSMKNTMLLSATWYSPLSGILHYTGFSAFREQLIMPCKKNPLCKQRPVPPPCVTLRLVLFSATRYSPLRGMFSAFGDFS